MEYCNVSGCYNDVKFILFTSFSCGHCISLKQSLSKLIASKRIEVVDLMTTKSDKLKAIFGHVSPARTVPVLALLDKKGNLIMDNSTNKPMAFMGIGPIMGLFQN